ncbi:MFS transporter [Streptomyces mesophilus]|uniref:MFS transporter n=1 Tax=Streptomyces mesophilus TaxID=1775132 RepID=UPI00331D66ED
MSTPALTATAPKLGRATLLAVCACVMVAQSMVAAINLLIPQLSSSALHPSASEIMWTVDAYVLAFAGLLIPAGAAADRYGRKGALLTGLALFAAGAMTSALAASPAVLIAGRAVCGIGAALITPSTMSILVQLGDTPLHRVRAMAAWTLAIGVGGAFGNLAGGLAGQYLGWRALFWLMVPLAAVLAGCVAYAVPRTGRSPRGNPDPLGTLLVTAALFALLFGIIEGPTYGWTSPRILGAFALGALLAAAFARHGLRSPAPLFDPRVFRAPRLSAAALGLATGFFGLFSLFFVNSQYLQGLKGYGPALAGLAIMPVSAGMALAPRFAARRHFPKLSAPLEQGRPPSPRPVITTGLALIGTGLLAASTAGAHTPYGLYVVWLLVISFGTGICMPALTIGVLEALPPHAAGLGSGLGISARELGAALGVAVTGTVLSADGGDYGAGMSSALRVVGAVVLVCTGLVWWGYGRRGRQA